MDKFKVKFFSDLNIIDIYSDENVRNNWKNCGLSIDKTSITNAILISQAMRYPLILDPQI